MCKEELRTEWILTTTTTTITARFIIACCLPFCNININGRRMLHRLYDLIQLFHIDLVSHSIIKSMLSYLKDMYSMT